MLIKAPQGAFFNTATRAINEDITQWRIRNMGETVNQVATEETKTFTQQELDAIVSDRLKRERAKYEGFEDFKAKALKYDELEEANKSELDKAHERVNTLETELNALKKAEEVRQIREKVAKETGIPAGSMSLITGETEEACQEQAKAILNIVTPSAYPQVADAGEVHHINRGSARDDFKEFASQFD